MGALGVQGWLTFVIALVGGPTRGEEKSEFGGAGCVLPPEIDRPTKKEVSKNSPEPLYGPRMTRQSSRARRVWEYRLGWEF